jgi:hypothetical protein
MEIEEELLRYNTVFYPELDFLHMLFHLILAMFAVVITMRVVQPEYMNTNLTFYLTLVTILLYIANLSKNTFALGYCKLTDETKVQILIAFKSFFVVLGLLVYTEGEALNYAFNIDVLGCHNSLVARINKLYALNDSSVTLTPQFTYVMLGFMAATISFVLVKPSISFSYYFFSMLRAQQRAEDAGYADGDENATELQQENNTKFRIKITLLYVVFLTPLVISFMFIHEMTGSLISSYFGLHQIIWETIRVGVVVMLLAVRLRTYREEL